MRANSHTASVHALQKSAQTLKQDFKEAGSRLLEDAKNLAEAGKSELGRYVERAPLITATAAFVVGGVIGYLLKRR